MVVLESTLRIDVAQFTVLDVDGQLELLKRIKFNILGNDRAKEILIENGTFQVIVDLLGRGEVELVVLKELSVLISLFSFKKENVSKLIAAGAIRCLISSCLNQQALYLGNLKALINILSLSSETHIDLRSSLGKDLIKLLLRILDRRNGHDLSLVFTACILIPYLPLHYLIPLVPAIFSQLSVLLKPVFTHISRDSSFEPTFVNYDNCLIDQSLPLSPPKLMIPNEVSPLLYSLAHIIPVVGSKFKLPKPLYFCLTALLTNESMNIRLLALNVLTFYSKYHLAGETKEVNYKKLVPPLINLVDQTRNFEYEEFTATSNYRIKHEMTPLFLLSILCKEDDILIDYLANCRIIDKVCEIIISNYNLSSTFKTEDTLNKVSDCFLILSGICSSREHYREEIVKYDLSVILSDILIRHYNILEEIQTSSVKQKNVDFVFELSNTVALSVCYFIRSLSRSVSLLRTYLLDLKITDLLVKLLRFPDLDSISDDLAGAQVVLKSVILGIISNFILDFSALKEDVLKNDISHAIALFIDDSNHDLLRISSLTLVGNYLSGISDKRSKDKFIGLISVNKIFELCYDDNSKVQERCFSIIRNLCLCSPSHGKKVMKGFVNSPLAKAHGDTDFLLFLTKKLILSDPHTDVDLVSNICYILVHLALSNERNRSAIVENHNLLHMIYSLLDDRQKTVSESKIVSPCIWLLINLTWKDETSSSESELEEIDVEISPRPLREPVKLLNAAERSAQLDKMGFHAIMTRLTREALTLDNRERSKTALVQLRPHSYS